MNLYRYNAQHKIEKHPITKKCVIEKELDKDFGATLHRCRSCGGDFYGFKYMRDATREHIEDVRLEIWQLGQWLKENEHRLE
jgi:hypothetical protein